MSPRRKASTPPIWPCPDDSPAITTGRSDAGTSLRRAGQAQQVDVRRASARRIDARTSAIDASPAAEIQHKGHEPAGFASNVTAGAGEEKYIAV